MEKKLYKVGFNCDMSIEYRYFACDSLTELDSYLNQFSADSIEILGDVYVIEKEKKE